MASAAFSISLSNCSFALMLVFLSPVRHLILARGQSPHTSPSFEGEGCSSEGEIPGSKAEA